MAKPIKNSNTSTLVTQPPKAKTKHSYRIEKLSQYEFQAYRATRLDDGSYVEEMWGKSTLFHLVAHRVFDAMNKEAAEIYTSNRPKPEPIKEIQK